MTRSPCDLKFTTSIIKNIVTHCLRATANCISDVAVSFDDWFVFMFPDENYYIDMVVGTEEPIPDPDTDTDIDSVEDTVIVDTSETVDAAVDAAEIVEACETVDEAVEDDGITDDDTDENKDTDIDSVTDDEESESGDDNDDVYDGPSRTKYWNLTSHFTSKINHDEPIAFKKKRNLALDVRTCHNGKFYKYVYDCHDVDAVAYPIYTREELDAVFTPATVNTETAPETAPDEVVAEVVAEVTDETVTDETETVTYLRVVSATIVTVTDDDEEPIVYDVTTEVSEYAGPEMDFYAKKSPGYKLRVSRMLSNIGEYSNRFYNSLDITDNTVHMCPSGSKLSIVDNLGNTHTFEHGDIIQLVAPPELQDSSWFGWGASNKKEV